MSVATQVKTRQGTTAQNAAFTGAVGEIVYDTQAKRLRVHDGATAGGAGVMKYPTDSGITILNFGAGPQIVIDPTAGGPYVTVNATAGSQQYYRGRSGGNTMVLLTDAGGLYGSYQSFGSNAGGRLGEFLFHDNSGVNPATDGGTLNCDIVPVTLRYEWHLDIINSAAGTRLLAANATTMTAVNDIMATNDLLAGNNVQATNNFVAQAQTGFTGALNDITSTKIADVVGGIIVQTYF